MSDLLDYSENSNLLQEAMSISTSESFGHSYQLRKHVAERLGLFSSEPYLDQIDFNDPWKNELKFVHYNPRFGNRECNDGHIYLYSACSANPSNVWSYEHCLCCEIDALAAKTCCTNMISMAEPDFIVQQAITTQASGLTKSKASVCSSDTLSLKKLRNSQSSCTSSEPLELKETKKTKKQKPLFHTESVYLAESIKPKVAAVSESMKPKTEYVEEPDFTVEQIYPTQAATTNKLDLLQSKASVCSSTDSIALKSKLKKRRDSESICTSSEDITDIKKKHLKPPSRTESERLPESINKSLKPKISKKERKEKSKSLKDKNKKVKEKSPRIFFSFGRKKVKKEQETMDIYVKSRKSSESSCSSTKLAKNIISDEGYISPVGAVENDAIYSNSLRKSYSTTGSLSENGKRRLSANVFTLPTPTNRDSSEERHLIAEQEAIDELQKATHRESIPSSPCIEIRVKTEVQQEAIKCHTMPKYQAEPENRPIFWSLQRSDRSSTTIGTATDQGLISPSSFSDTIMIADEIEVDEEGWQDRSLLADICLKDLPLDNYDVDRETLSTPNYFSLPVRSGKTFYSATGEPYLDFQISPLPKSRPLLVSLIRNRSNRNPRKQRPKSEHSIMQKKDRSHQTVSEPSISSVETVTSLGGLSEPWNATPDDLNEEIVVHYPITDTDKTITTCNESHCTTVNSAMVDTKEVSISGGKKRVISEASLEIKPNAFEIEEIAITNYNGDISEN